MSTHDRLAPPRVGRHFQNVRNALVFIAALAPALSARLQIEERRLVGDATTFMQVEHPVVAGSDFERIIGGPAYDRGVHVTPIGDEGYAAVGATASSGKGGQDVYLVRTDTGGKVLWTRTYGGDADDHGWSVGQTADGLILAGFTKSFGAGGFDFYLIKTDMAGEVAWWKTYGGKGDDRCWALATTKDGGFVLAGETNSRGKGERDILLIKTDSEGKESWSRTFGGEKDDRCFSIAVTEDGGYVLAGQTYSEGAGDRDAYVIKTDGNGEMQWSKTFGGAASDVGHSVCRTSDGNYLVTGYTTSFAEERDDPYLVKIAPDGGTKWTRVLHLAGTSRTITGEQAADGGFYCVGFTTGRNRRVGKALLLKTDAEGRLTSHRTFFLKTPGESFAYTVRATEDGGCVFTGHTTREGNRDLFIVKVAAAE